MKGEEAEYIIPLRGVFSRPKTKRLRKALNEVREFALKHTKISNIAIMPDLNKFLHARSWNMPRKVLVVIRKSEGKVLVYLKGSKQIEEDKKREKEREEKAAKKGKGEKAGKEEEKETKEEKEAEEEKERKKEEKREKEKAAEKSAIKRKIRE